MRRRSVTLVLAFAAAACFGFGGRRAQNADALINQNPKVIESDYLSVAEVKAKQEYEKERGISFPKLVRGNPARKEIALTFDDGPHPGRTERLLEILRQANVKATFFVIGKLVDKHPELAQMEAADGHEVANHTYDHVRLATIPPAMIETELRNGAAAIDRAIGSPVRLYRPPGGEYDSDVIRVTKEIGSVMVLWTDDPADFVQPGTGVIMQRVLRRVSNGGILLLHDGVPQTLDILPDLIAKLKARGYKFVTCSEMARQSGVIKEGGPRVAPGQVSRLPRPRRKPALNPSTASLTSVRAAAPKTTLQPAIIDASERKVVRPSAQAAFSRPGSR